MKYRTKLAQHTLFTAMALIGTIPAFAGATPRPEPQCEVTETKRLKGPYADETEIVKQTLIPFRWTQGSTSDGYVKAQALLPEGGKAVLKISPGYGMRFHELTLTSAQGKTVHVSTMTPWYPLFVDTGFGDAHQLVDISRVSTSLELLLESTCRPGGPVYCTTRTVTAECSFNPLISKESE